GAARTCALPRMGARAPFQAGACLRVEACVGPPPADTAIGTTAPSILRGRALLGKAGVRISAAPSSSSLALSPITSRPWTPPPTIALPGATSPSSRSSWRPSARPDRADRHRGARSDSPNLERPVAAVRTIAFVLPRPYVARSRWRQRDRADPGPNTPRRTFGIAQEQSLGRVRA